MIDVEGDTESDIEDTFYCDDFYKYFRNMVVAVTAEVSDISGVSHVDSHRAMYAMKYPGTQYKYSSKELKRYKWGVECGMLAHLASEKIKSRYGHTVVFHTALVTYYQDGFDSISPYTEKECAHSYMASWSFGASRRLDIYSSSRDNILKCAEIGKKVTWNNIESINLDNGSLFIMKPGMHSGLYKYGISPSSFHKGYINLTLRSSEVFYPLV